MNVNPIEPEEPAESADGPAGHPSDENPAAGMSASPDGEGENHRREESVDEPGYGHGV